MSRILAIVFGVGLIAAPAVPAPKAKDTPALPDYCPSTVGTTWVYEISNGDGEVTFRVMNVEDMGATKLVSRERYEMSRWFPHERVAVSARGLQKVEMGECPIDPPYFELKFPVKVGDKWDFQFPSKHGPQFGLIGKKGTIEVLGEEEVRVPAGKFKAVKVLQVVTEENGRPLGRSETVHSYWAEGIGRVRVTTTGGTNMDLKSFTRGK